MLYARNILSNPCQSFLLLFIHCLRFLVHHCTHERAALRHICLLFFVGETSYFEKSWLIEMITGLPAWNHIPTSKDLMFKFAFLKEAPPLPSGLSPLCEDFLNKCFLKDPHPFLSSKLPPTSVPGHHHHLLEPSLLCKDFLNKCLIKGPNKRCTTSVLLQIEILIKSNSMTN